METMYRLGLYLVFVFPIAALAVMFVISVAPENPTVALIVGYYMYPILTYVYKKTLGKKLDQEPDSKA